MTRRQPSAGVPDKEKNVRSSKTGEPARRTRPQRPPEATGRQRSAGVPDKEKNVRAPETVEPPRPWTEEEMARAKPLPVPTVNAAPGAHAPGLPYTGMGEVKPAGRPERHE
jgi:hypothetical protein